MRVARIALAVVGISTLAACTHRVAPHTPTDSPHGSATLRSSVIQIYVDGEPSAKTPTGSPQAPTVLGNALIGALRAQLQQHGFDVRAAECVSPASGTTAAAIGLARSVVAGDALPAVSRPLTYIHPNAPRLLLVASLRAQPDDQAGNGAHDRAVLAAYLADSADGALLWSNRITTRKPLTDEQLRLFAEQLLATLPQPPN